MIIAHRQSSDRDDWNRSNFGIVGRPYPSDDIKSIYTRHLDMHQDNIRAHH